MTQPDSSSALGLGASTRDDSASLPRSADPFDLVGAVVDRKYAVDRPVAEGGYGVVYRGHHTSLGVAVAIKLLKLEPDERDATAADMIAGFIQEAHSVARLRHANIVSVLDAGEHFSEAVGRSVPYIVFEWLDGPTLAADLGARRGHGGRTLGEAMVLWRPVCEAIAFAHQARIVHRDLKPKNIIIQGTPERPLPKVLDFGIAKSYKTTSRAPDSTRTDSGRLAFSPDYAAPEQLAGTRTGPWTDVHALGLLLVELLIDLPPYGEADPAERYAQAFSADRPTPKRFGIDLGPLERVLARALCLKPRGRYANASELLAAVDEAFASDHWADANQSSADRQLEYGMESVAETSRTGPPPGESALPRPSTVRDATVLTRSVPSRSPRPRWRALTVAGIGAALGLGLFAGWRFAVVRPRVDPSAVAGHQDAPDPDPRRSTSSSARLPRDVPSAHEHSPLRGAPPESKLATDSEGRALPTAPAPEVKAHPPTARVPGSARPVSVERGSTRSEAEPIVSSTASSPAPVVTTPGVPAPYRLE